MADFMNRFNSKNGVSLEEAVQFLRDSAPELQGSAFYPYLDLEAESSVYSLPEFSSAVYLSKDGLLGEHWAERFGTISKGRVKIYMAQLDYQPRNFLNFDVMTCTIKVIRGCIFTIQALESSKVQKFKTASKEEFHEWALALYCNYFRSAGFRSPLNTVVCFKQYWKKSFITFEQIRREAETCDLMLFAGRNIGSLAVRLVSRSDYDHVAVLIRGENGELFVVESLSNGGVQIHEFNDQLIFCWNSDYKTVSYRKLVCLRDEDFNDRVIDKTVEWCGIPYGLGVRELARQVSTQSYQTFFCSELIAALYKHLGFISRESPTNQFWPSSFGPSKKLELTNATLGEVSYAVFNSHS